jgi:hypothetical protein
VADKSGHQHQYYGQTTADWSTIFHRLRVLTIQVSAACYIKKHMGMVVPRSVTEISGFNLTSLLSPPSSARFRTTTMRVYICKVPIVVIGSVSRQQLHKSRYLSLTVRRNRLIALIGIDGPRSVIAPMTSKANLRVSYTPTAGGSFALRSIPVGRCVELLSFR